MANLLRQGKVLRIPEVVRCMAFRDGAQWVACTLEFGLAVQADDLNAAKTKIESQIVDYLKTALSDEDREFSRALLARRAPARAYFAWYLAQLAAYLRAPSRESKIFLEPTPQLSVCA